MADTTNHNVGLVRVMTPEQVNQQKLDAEKDILATPDPEPVQLSLCGYIEKCWEEARNDKRQNVEPQMLKNMRQIAGIYEPDMLNAIRDAEAPEYFIMLTDAKCRAAKAWLKEVLCQPGHKPWDIDPTPSPQLPPDAMQAIRQQFVSEMFSAIAATVGQSQGNFDPMQVFSGVQALVPKFEDELDTLIKQESKRRTEKLRDRIDDDLTEGGWYQAIADFIGDVVDMKAGFIKGPVPRKEPTIEIAGGTNGPYKINVVERFVDRYERRSPFNIYPQPGSKNVQDGYLIDLISLKPKDLVALKGIPGFHDDEIDAVLEEYRAGGLHEWVTFDSDKLSIEQKPTDSTRLSGNIDCLEFWGCVQGQMLLDWGMKSTHIPDPLMEYDVCAWKIGTHLIGALLNPDPLKQKPFHKVSYKEKPDCFWGDGLPEVIVDPQRACNSAARAIIHNIGVASGPQVEVNKDRLAPGESTKIWPWRTWLTTDDQMTGNKALNFYAPPMVVERLIMVFNFFSKIADDHSVPGYAHGDAQVGGAGNTASGLSMLMTQAAKGIKNLIGDIDLKIITSTVKAQFYKTIQKVQNLGLIPDFKIVAKGALALMEKEQQAIRRIEFLQMTNNPVDIQLMGSDGRKYLLKTAARAMDLEEDRLLPDHVQTQPMLPAQNMASQPSPETLDQAGNPVVGAGVRQFNSGPNPGVNNATPAQ
jgi:hypothetical protein